MSEVLAQLEKKGGNGKLQTEFLITSAASGQSLGCYLIPIDFVKTFSKVRLTRVAGSGFQRGQLRYLNSSLSILVDHGNLALNQDYTMQTIPSDAVYCLIGVVASGSNFNGETTKFTFS